MPKHEKADEAAQEKIRRPVKLTDAQWDKMREMAFVWFRRPIEELAGEWLGAVIDAEYKKGRPKR